MGYVGRHRNELFVAGGRYDGNNISTLQIYDFTTRMWRLGECAPTSLEHLALLLMGSYIWSFEMMVYDVEQQGPPQNAHGQGGGYSPAAASY